MSEPPPEPANTSPCTTCGAPSHGDRKRCATCIGSAAMAEKLDATQNIRTKVCRHCAAPLVGPREGATLPCPCCGEAVAIRRLGLERLRVPAPDGSSGGSDRAAQFNAALRSLDGSPYQLGLPDVVARRDPGSPDTLHHIHEAFRAACRPLQERADRRQGGGAYRQAAAAQPELGEAEHEVCALAHWALELGGIGQRWLRARPLLEQAYELCTDPAYRQLMLCDLARLAEEVGHLEVADQWLTSCDPVAAQLEADGAYRLRKARLAARRGQWEGVLQAVGQAADVLPTARPLQIPMGLLRVAAFERQSQSARADHAIKELADVHLVADIERELAEDEQVADGGRAWERLRARWAEEDRRKRRIEIIKGLVLTGVGVALMGIAAMVFWESRMNTLECERPRAEPKAALAAVAPAASSEPAARPSSGPPTCRIHESLIGKRVDTYPIAGLRDARVATRNEGSKDEWSELLLITADGEHELSSCSKCVAELTAQQGTIQRYLASPDERRLVLLEPSENPGPFIAFAAAVSGVAMILLGLGRALKARFAKPVRA